MTTENIAEPSHCLVAALATAPDESRAMRVGFSDIATNDQS
jgi:hypothetical protein